jgi:Cu/Ag efflux protein CusF
MKAVLVIIVSFLFFLSFISLPFIAEGGMGTQSWEQIKREIPKRVTGEVTAVDLTTRIINIKTADGDLTAFYNDSTVFTMGDENKTIADIKVGDKVTVKYKEGNYNNIITSIAINPKEGTEHTEKK